MLIFAKSDEHPQNLHGSIEALSGLVAMLTSCEGDFDKFIPLVLQFLKDMTYGKIAVFDQFDVERGCIGVSVARGAPLNFRKQKDLAGYIFYEDFIIRKKSLSVYEDLSQTVYWSCDQDIKRHHLKACAGFPLKVDGKIIGSLAVFDDSPRTFEPFHLNVLQILAHAISQRLLQRRFEAQLLSSRNHHRLFSKLLAESMSLQEDTFLNDCLETIGSTFGLSAASIFWLESDCVASHPAYWNAGLLVDGKLDAHEEILSHPTIQNTLKNMNYYCGDADCAAEQSLVAILQKHNISSFFIAPVIAKQKAAGAFIMDARKRDCLWDEQFPDLVMPFMNIISQWKLLRTLSDRLDECEKLKDHIFENAPVPIYQIDLKNLCFVKVNRMVCQATGYSKEELMAIRPDSLLTPESQEFFYSSMADLKAGRFSKKSLELQIITKSGKLEWGNFWLHHLYEDGELLGANVMVHVITEQKKFSEELTIQRDVLEALVKERTSELSKANRQLREEIVRRTETAKELQLKSERLKELNIAMQVLLDKRSEDRLRSEENIRVNLVQLIEPYLDRLNNSGLNAEQRQLLDVIKMNLVDVVGEPMPELSAKYYIFSPAELQVANLIRNGKTTKDIARMFNLSPRTVDSYRNNIRKKLGLKNKKVNLKTFLSSKE